VSRRRTESPLKTEQVRATTVLAVVRNGRIALAADGQVTVGNAVMKHGAQKVRRSQAGRALYGFAGGAADALALSERLEVKLEAHPGNVRRAAVELARDWRMDRALRRLEAMLLVGDAETIAREALGIAAEICIYTNERIQVLALP